MEKITNIELDDVHLWDAPDFVDAYICNAEHEDGTPLTDEELETLNDDREFVYECIQNYLH